MSRSRDQVVSVAELAARVRAAQDAGEVVVLCHGCFDIVHPGHVRHLQQARKLGDRLIVTVSGDVVVAKGVDRPLIPQELRAENLAALDCVDWVAVSDEVTAVPLLRAIRPDVYVKGREYEENRDPRFEEEQATVRAYGGRVVFTSGDVIFSSTALIDAMEETAHPGHAMLRRLVREHGLERSSLDATVSAFRDQRVLVIGETIRDTYVLCDRPVVASESPVLTLRPLEYRSFDAGAAIIARHLAAMGARPTLITALPRSPEAEALRLRLEVEGIGVHAVEVDGPIIEKQRYLVGTDKVMKVDLGDPHVLDTDARQRVVEMACERAGGHAGAGSDAAIIADFGQGLFTSPMMKATCERLRPHVRVLAGDVSGRRSNLLAMRRMDLLSPSEVEMREALHAYEDGLGAVAWEMLSRTRSQSAMVTLGAEGLIAFEPRKRGRPTRDWASRLHAEPVPALTTRAVDQLGCGDALLAAATLTLAVGGALGLAAVIGATAAAIQARSLGNAVVGADALRRGLARLLETRLAFDPSALPATGSLVGPAIGADPDRRPGAAPERRAR